MQNIVHKQLLINLQNICENWGDIAKRGVLQFSLATPLNNFLGKNGIQRKSCIRLINHGTYRYDSVHHYYGLVF